ncbi:MAG: AAA family ATPase [Dysgonamonadaceae bacterium]|jgi:predicted AAA+ superfamily ATPase|nr:AAA family ATPase [Dysgonamonadaceae bacterium]
MQYFYRNIEPELLQWKNGAEHFPLLIRGARQVGKSSVIREFGKQFDYFLEINFEISPDMAKVFDADLQPQRICQELSLFYNIPVEAGKTLLFFDEIQSCVPAISSLRFFYEKMPELHVIAAGSLLEFALEELPSFGVGRVRSLYLYPFSFDEFLNALGENLLAKAIANASPENPLPEIVHTKALNLYKRFLIIGGMPKVVSYYVQTGNLLKCQQVLDDLFQSYQDDFVKYRKRVSNFMLLEVLRAVVRQNGGKFVYSKATPELNALQVKFCLELLVMAGLIFPVTHTAANGLPLGAEANPKFRKYFLLDTGIFHRMMQLDLSDLLLNNDFESINKGAIAELFTGLELLKSSTSRMELYYWHRETRNSQAEIDFLWQKQRKILPIEVKSGKKGSMQSLYIFLKEKGLEMGIRVSQENFSKLEQVSIIPLYAVKNIKRN